MTIILDGTTGITTPAINSSGDLELPGGTANGVLYLNGSKIATSGSALVFDGTNLGVGTSSAAYKLDVRGSTDTSYLNITSTADANGTTLRIGTDATAAFINATGGSSGTLQLRTYGLERARIDSSGNLLVGTTSALNSSNVQISVGSGASSTPRLGIFNTASTPTSSASTQIQMGFASGGANYVATDTIIGQIGFLGQANDDAYGGASIQAKVVSGGNVGRGSGHGVDLIFGTKPTDNTGVLERARITSGGSLLVGTTSSSRKFAVASSGDTYASIVAATNSVASLLLGDTDSDSVGRLTYDNSDNSMRFLTNSDEHARITSGGDLCINTTVSEGPAKVSTVSGSSGTACYSARNSAGAGSTFFSFINNNDTALIGTITNNGNTATAYNTTSDARLKENIAPADDAGSVVDAIQIVKHDWKVGGHVRYGVIAQDLHEIAPEAVAVGDGDDVDELKRPWGVDYSKLVPMLVKEIQSLRARLAAAGL